MRTIVTTPPSVYPVALSEAKEHLRIDSTITNQDGYINALIAVATDRAEKFTGRRFIRQTITGYLDVFPLESYVELPFGQLASVTSINYLDTDGNSTVWDSGEYIVDTVNEPGRVVLGYGKSWPSETLYPSNPINIVFACGWENAGDVPAMIKHAIKLAVSDMFDAPGSLTLDKYYTAVNLKTFESALWPYKIWTKQDH